MMIQNRSNEFLFLLALLFCLISDLNQLIVKIIFCTETDLTTFSAYFEEQLSFALMIVVISNSQINPRDGVLRRRRRSSGAVKPLKPQNAKRHGHKPKDYKVLSFSG